MDPQEDGINTIATRYIIQSREETMSSSNWTVLIDPQIKSQADREYNQVWSDFIRNWRKERHLQVGDVL